MPGGRGGHAGEAEGRHTTGLRWVRLLKRHKIHAAGAVFSSLLRPLTIHQTKAAENGSLALITTLEVEGEWEEEEEEDDDDDDDDGDLPSASMRWRRSEASGKMGVSGISGFSGTGLRGGGGIGAKVALGEATHFGVRTRTTTKSERRNGNESERSGRRRLRRNRSAAKNESISSSSFSSSWSFWQTRDSYLA